MFLTSGISGRNLYQAFVTYDWLLGCLQDSMDISFSSFYMPPHAATCSLFPFCDGLNVIFILNVICILNGSTKDIIFNRVHYCGIEWSMYLISFIRIQLDCCCHCNVSWTYIPLQLGCSLFVFGYVHVMKRWTKKISFKGNEI